MTAAAIGRPELRRWSMSAVVVIGLHAMATAPLLTWRDPIGIGEPSSAVVVDLAPFAAAPRDAVEKIMPGPKQQQAEQPPTAHGTIEPKVEEKADMPLVPPLAALPPFEGVNPKPPAPPHVRPSPATMAPPRARASRVDINSWYGKIVTQLQRHKFYPQEAQSRGEKGVVQLSFSIDREGRVVSSRIVRSSGYAALDQETIATVRRAQPFPPPPHDISGAKFDFTVPVEFNIR